jgi:hypothetical protein
MLKVLEVGILDPHKKKEVHKEISHSIKKKKWKDKATKIHGI